MINNKYNLIEKIGEGSFGSIYKGQNIRTKEYVAVKVEPIMTDTKLLKNESIIYQYLNNTHGIPLIKWFGKDMQNYYMVIDLLGSSLESLKEKTHVFTLNFISSIGIQITLLLKSIHEKGLIHRDIKPDNFLFGLGRDKGELFLIDFGFCKSYMQNNKHIPFKKIHNLIGSKTYASINSHNCLELSRRDDMESLGYMLAYLYLGSLSWQYILQINNVNNVNIDLNEKIKELKTSIINDIHLPNILVNYIKYARSLDFEQEPDYNYIIHEIFQREIKK
jgi:casein kinase I family protein HRR25